MIRQFKLKKEYKKENIFIFVAVIIIKYLKIGKAIINMLIYFIKGIYLKNQHIKLIKIPLLIKAITLSYYKKFIIK